MHGHPGAEADSGGTHAARVATDEAKAAVEQASRAKDHFLAVLSHELRTPLAPVLAAASLLEVDEQLPARFRDDVAIIRRNAELEARLIDDLLDVTRIVRGKLSLNVEPVDLGDVIRRAIEVCRPDIEAKRLQLVSGKRKGRPMSASCSEAVA